jgi:hypothetical protein
MAIHISMHLPGTELTHSAIDEAITFMATHIAIEKRHGRLPEGPTLDITFMLPGKHEKPDFNGMRMGGYTPENQTLYFETAVPESMAQSEKAPYYVAMILEDVIDNAGAFFAETDVPFNLEHWRTALQKLIAPEKTQTRH